MISNEITETEETKGARRATGVSSVSMQRVNAPDSEVKAPIKRPRHTANYKREVVDRVNELRNTGSGAIGSYLRSKGVYWGTVKRWEKQMKPGINKTVVSGSKEKVLEEKVKKLEKELEYTRKKLAKSELIIEFQKKISQLLEPDQDPLERKSSLGIKE